MRFFTISFVMMFVWFWLPGCLWTGLSTFNWISWIAPNNPTLNNITGSINGLGLNPWPTFDFNIVCAWIQNNYNPLVFPAFSTINILIGERFSFFPFFCILFCDQLANPSLGMVLSFFFIVGFYWQNTWNSSYLPINSNHIFDNTGAAYNVSRAIDSRGIYDGDKYQQYSQPWLSAGSLSVYFWFFAQVCHCHGCRRNLLFWARPQNANC